MVSPKLPTNFRILVNRFNRPSDSGFPKWTMTNEGLQSLWIQVRLLRDGVQFLANNFIELMESGSFGWHCRGKLLHAVCLQTTHISAHQLRHLH